MQSTEPEGGSRQSSTVDRLITLMKSTRALLFRYPISEETAEQHLRKWMGLVNRYDIDRFERSLQIAVDWEVDFYGNNRPRKSFPMPSEIEAFMPSAPSRTKFAKPDCQECFGSGQKITERGAVTCPCKLR